jgi:uncharacterized membrane protein YoaK (UPF0700 family)
VPAASPAPLLPALSLTLAIVALAGFVDALSFMQFKGLFVSFMSGNTTSLGVAIAKDNIDKLEELALAISLFIGGVVLGTLLHNRAGDRWSASLILSVVAALLSLAHAYPPLAIEGLTLGMGVLNASVHEVGGTKVSLTFVTGTLVKFGTGLANLLSGRQESWGWLWQLTLWLGFLGGALAGAAALLHLPKAALLLAAFLSFALALLAALVPRGVR